MRSFISFNTVDVVPPDLVWDCYPLGHPLWRARVMREQTIECPDSIVLACQCGEWVVLIGRLVDWYEEDRLEFSCDCGRILTLSNRMPDTSDRLAGSAEPRESAVTTSEDERKGQDSKNL